VSFKELPIQQRQADQDFCIASLVFASWPRQVLNLIFGMQEQPVYWGSGCFLFRVKSGYPFGDETKKTFRSKRNHHTTDSPIYPSAGAVEKGSEPFGEFRVQKQPLSARGIARNTPQSKTGTLWSKNRFRPGILVPESNYSIFREYVQAAQADKCVTSSRESEAHLHLLCAQC
jgi:hypothetical protein